jgi:hypothetical protein
LIAKTRGLEDESDVVDAMQRKMKAQKKRRTDADDSAKE